MPASNSSNSLLQNRPNLFSPSVVRDITNRSAGSVSFTLDTLQDMKDTGLNNPEVFKYNLTEDGLKSTQQLNIDWSNFANHTFYNSAQVKVNVAFDRILNEYPFDGTNKDAEIFLDSLTGFEKYVFDNFPKNIGYLYFSGTLSGETSGGTYVTVKDFAGVAYPNMSIRQDGRSVINPLDKPLTIEYWIYPSAQANSNQVLLQQISGSDGYSVYHYANVSTTQMSAEFKVLQGTVSSSVACTIPKGEWSHVAWVWNRDFSNKDIYVYLNGTLAATSSVAAEFGILDVTNDLLIGSGSSFAGFTPQTTFSGSLDELRIWHKSRSPEELDEFMKKSVYASDDLKAYYKFNETSGSYSSLVVDASSNSLHGKLSTAALTFGVREIPTGSLAGPTPMTSEDVNKNPVLFPKHPAVVDYSTTLLLSASQYDGSNPSLITKLIPKHYFLEGQSEFALPTEEGPILDSLLSGTDPRSSRLGATQTFLLLLYTWAKYFDEMKLYSQAFSDINFVDYNATDTVPSQFLQKLGRSLGLELPQLFTGATIKQYIDGENYGDDYSLNQNTLKDIQNQIWRRILINYKDIVRSKGTIHSIKAFIRALGIEPDNNFRIREYGGPSKRNLSYVRDKKSQRATQLSFLDGGYLRSSNLLAKKVEPGFPPMPPLALPIAEYDEGFVAVTAATSVTITFGITFSSPPIFVAEADDLSVNVFGTTAPSTTGITVQFSAPFTGNIHYRAAYSPTYPAYASSIYSPNLVISANTITVPDANTTQNVSYTTLPGLPTIIRTFPIDTLGNNLSNIFLSTASETASTTDILLSAPAQNSRIDYIAYGDYNDAISPPFVSGETVSLLIGSWTYEGLYRFTDASFPSQSLVRINTTGSLGESVLINCVASEDDLSLKLFVRPNESAASTEGLLELELENVDLFDGNLWHISFGQIHPNDDLMTYTTPSSSFFLRAARQDNGEVAEKYEATSYFEDDAPVIFANRLLVTGSATNASGAYIAIGSASIDTSITSFLNETAAVGNDARYTVFDGRVSNIKFWSRAVRHDEWLEHVRNFKSSGVNTPLVNYNFNTVSTGSFERLRIDAAAQQDIVETDSLGNIRIFDYSQNNYHFSGSNFPPSENVLLAETFYYSYLSPKIDEAATTNKVRVRSYLDFENVVDNELAQVAPLYDLPANEISTDSTKFTIDYSITNALDEDIISMFGTYKALDDIIGAPELLYSPDYPGLEELRDIYYNRLTDKVSVKAFFEFYKWFDTNIGNFIEQLLPRKAKYMGINYVLESSILERNKIEYQSYEQYLGEGDRGSLKDTILLSFYEGTSKRY